MVSNSFLIKWLIIIEPEMFFLLFYELGSDHSEDILGNKQLSRLCTRVDLLNYCSCKVMLVLN
jgi:hypothetical protein